jgi:hypothetical protein
MPLYEALFGWLESGRQAALEPEFAQLSARAAADAAAIIRGRIMTFLRRGAEIYPPFSSEVAPRSGTVFGGG